MENNLVLSDNSKPKDICNYPESVKRIFLCYHKKGARYAQCFKSHVNVRRPDHQIEVWDATQIPAGSLWQREISAARERAQIAVLLLSAGCFDEDFLNTYELPSLLTAAQGGNIWLLPVIARPFDYKGSLLAPFQPCNPEKALAFFTDPARDLFWISLVRSIINYYQKPTSSSVSSIASLVGCQRM